jgi:hypothetical protein
MSIEDGQRYKITNAKGGTALDLSSDDEYTIAGWDWHGGDNQIVHSFLSRPGVFSDISGLFSGKPLPTAESGTSGAPRAANTLPSRREIRVMASASLARTSPSVGTSGPTNKMRAFTGMLSGLYDRPDVLTCCRHIGSVFPTPSLTLTSQTMVTPPAAPPSRFGAGGRLRTSAGDLSRVRLLRIGRRMLRSQGSFPFAV